MNNSKISEMRKHRLLQGLTLDDIYQRTSIEISRLSRIERGIYAPTEKEKELISKVLKISKAVLFPSKD